MGFGGSGERVLNTPCSGRSGSPRDARRAHRGGRGRATSAPGSRRRLRGRATPVPRRRRTRATRRARLRRPDAAPRRRRRATIDRANGVTTCSAGIATSFVPACMMSYVLRTRMSRTPPGLRPTSGGARPEVPDREEHGVKYLLMIHMNPTLLESLSEEERNAIFGAHDEFQAQTKRRASWSDSRRSPIRRTRRRYASETGRPPSPTGRTSRRRSSSPATTSSTATRSSARRARRADPRRARTRRSRSGRS